MLIHPTKICLPRFWVVNQHVFSTIFHLPVVGIIVGVVVGIVIGVVVVVVIVVGVVFVRVVLVVVVVVVGVVVVIVVGVVVVMVVVVVVGVVDGEQFVKFMKLNWMMELWPSSLSKSLSPASNLNVDICWELLRADDFRTPFRERITFPEFQQLPKPNLIFPETGRIVLIEPIFSTSFPGLPLHPYHLFPSPQLDHISSGTYVSGSGYNHCPWLTLISQADKFFVLDPTNSFKRSDKSLQSIVRKNQLLFWWFLCSNSIEFSF